MAQVNTLYRTYRNRLCRIVYSCMLVLLVYEFLSHGLVHQLQSPPLIYPYIDITYIFFNATGLLDYITGNTVAAIVFDILLFGCCIVLILYPGKRLFSFLFIALYFIYFLIYNNYGCHHVHSKIGALLITVPFLFSSPAFIWIWQGLRYYTLYLYCSAFLWKFFRGSWIHKGQGASILENNMMPVLYRNPDHPFKGIYTFLFTHPGVADIMFTLGVIMEGVFIIGFFTKRYDRLLIANAIMLAIAFLVFSDAFAYELLILCLTLYFNKVPRSP